MAGGPPSTRTLVVDALAAYRLTRLVTTDAITEPLREAIDARSDFMGELTSCSWCSGVWVAAGVVLARRYVPAWGPVAEMLALAAVAGLLSDALV